LTGWEERLKISDRAHLVFDFHQAVDGMQESNREGLANTTELTDDLGAWIQKEGREFGVTTGRPRRCGWLDIPLLKFTSQLNGYTALCLTKTDILDKLDEVKIGVAYVKDGKKLDHYPSGIFQFDGLSVEYITMPGWKTSIANCRSFDELPFKWVGVGPSRDAMILRPDA